MNSLELVNELYKPYRITKLGSATVIEAMDGKFVIKEKTEKDIKELFKYLHSRDFKSVPELVDDTRSDIDIYEYIESVDYPKEQKSIDLIKVVGSLHSKTSFFKEVRENKYKEIYDNIKANLEVSESKYKDYVKNIEEKVFMSPSEYLFIRNSSKLMNEIAFTRDKLDDWYEIVKDKRSSRVSVIHNNLSMDHFLKGNKEALISWDKSSVDSPILDIYNFYKKEALNLEFGSILKEYLNVCSLSSDELNLLIILLCLPPTVEFKSSEPESVSSMTDALDYVFKTEYLVKPYCTTDDVDE